MGSSCGFCVFYLGFHLGFIWVRNWFPYGFDVWFDLGCNVVVFGFYSGFMLSVFRFYLGSIRVLFLGFYWHSSLFFI